MPNALEKVHPPFDPEGERFKWLDERLPILPLVEEGE